MSPMRRALAFLVAMLALCGLVLPLAAQDADKALRDDLHTIISRQIDAFGRDDAAAAQEFAAAGIKDKFKDPEGFLAMAKQSYGALVRPRDVIFGATTRTPSGAMQEVSIIDAQGDFWAAIYSFEGSDHHWLINGCVLGHKQATPI